MGWGGFFSFERASERSSAASSFAENARVSCETESEGRGGDDSKRDGKRKKEKNKEKKRKKFVAQKSVKIFEEQQQKKDLSFQSLFGGKSVKTSSKSNVIKSEGTVVIFFTAFGVCS